MFVNFFISFFDNFLTSGMTSKKESDANPDSTYKVPVEISTNFNSFVNTLCTRLCINDHYLYNNREDTRIVLINIPDDITFQLELLGVTENSYCTYNIESKKIGFGNTRSHANNASMTYNSLNSGTYGTGFSGIFNNTNNPDKFFNFIGDITIEPEKFQFQVPDTFHNGLFNELMPYIRYEKSFMFNEVVNEMLHNSNEIFSHIENFFGSSYKDTLSRKVLKVSPTHFKKAVELYMNDDEDILLTKYKNQNNFEFMRNFCFKIMKLTNETF